MTESETERAINAVVASYYAEKLKEFGATARGVDWRDEASQALRHRQFLYLLGDEREVSVIDLGCGYGDFLGFLLGQGFGGRYIGYDIVAEMLDAARRLYGEDRGRQWKVGAVPDEIADFVVASGIFNVKRQFSPDIWQEHVLHTIDAMARASRRGFAFNVLTGHSDLEFMRPDLFYADPTFFLNHCVARYGRRVALLQDYGLHEFTLIVRHG